MTEEATEYRDLRAAIDRFREESEGPKPKFPVEIRTCAVAAVNKIGVIKASELLGISRAALSRWRKSPSAASKRKVKRQKFVELEPAAAKPAVLQQAAMGKASPTAVVTITTPSGLAVSVDSNVPLSYATALLAEVASCFR